MGSSTTTLQSVVDFVATMGELSTVIPSGGYSTSQAVTIANDVMQGMIAQRYNFKWNSFKLPRFWTNSYQQDYAQISMSGVGWLEHCTGVDINNPIEPKPRCHPKTVRQLGTTSRVAPWVEEICWMYNSQLDQADWPGPNVIYTDPTGLQQTTQQPKNNILDANGNILVLTQYGTTGTSAPAAASGALPGTVVNDGSCKWTVADPNGMGFRIFPLFPASGRPLRIFTIGQRSAPLFTKLSALLTPIPDDFAGYFRTGFVAFAHKYSADPAKKKDFPMMRMDWEKALTDASKQGDREPDDAAFVPARSVVDPGDRGPIGPGDPYNWAQWGWD